MPEGPDKPPPPPPTQPPPQSPQEPRRLELRKYPNRRYYDSTRSRHVTLEEIHALIRAGYEIQVTDSKTGDDITAKVLAQIIIDLDPPKLGVFPVALLHRVLRSNEQLLGDFVRKWFSQPLGAFLDSQHSFEQYLRQAMGVRTAAPTAADWTRMLFGPFNPMAWTGSTEAPPPATSAAATGPTAEAPVEPAGPDVPAPSPGATEQDLHKIIEDMRRQLDELKRVKGKRRRPATATAANATSPSPKASTPRKRPGKGRRGR